MENAWKRSFIQRLAVYLLNWNSQLPGDRFPERNSSNHSHSLSMAVINHASDQLWLNINHADRTWLQEKCQEHGRCLCHNVNGNFLPFGWKKTDSQLLTAEKSPVCRWTCKWIITTLVGKPWEKPSIIPDVPGLHIYLRLTGPHNSPWTIIVTIVINWLMIRSMCLMVNVSVPWVPGASLA